MADFSVATQEYNQVVITSLSHEAVGIERSANTGAAGGVAAWPTSNKAIFVPIVVHNAFVAVKMFVIIGAASGNIDVGIYDDQKNRIVSSGATAQAGSTAIQEFDITDTTLNPGRYYMAVAADNTTGTIFRHAFSNVIWAGGSGMLMQTSAYTLPNPANWVAAVDVYVPYVAVTGRTTV